MSKYKVEDHLRLVGKIAKRYSQSTDIEYEEAFQEGCIGLFKACQNYKEGPVPFGAYAGQQITFSILHCLRKGTKLIHTPTNIIDIAMSVSRHNLLYTDISEIADKLKVSETKVRSAMNYLYASTVSIDVARSGGRSGDEDMYLKDILRAEQDEMSETQLFLMDLRKHISDIEYKILRLLVKGYKTKEIAEMINLNDKYVKNTLSLLRKRFRNDFRRLKEDIVASGVTV